MQISYAYITLMNSMQMRPIVTLIRLRLLSIRSIVMKMSSIFTSLESRLLIALLCNDDLILVLIGLNK